MRTNIMILFLVASASAFATPSVSDVIVRQQWPWKSDVTVDFLINGSVVGVSQIAMAAYRGDKFLGYIPQCACSDELAVTSGGLKRISFDPSAVDFLVANGPMGDFRLDVTVTEVAAEEILYKIFDLTKTAGAPGAVAYVTEQALTNGMWGAWERDYWGADMARTVIWTGVTNNPAYKTTHLVMRRIPEGEFAYGTSKDCSLFVEADTPRMTLTMPKAYYIAVFETTISQYEHIFDPAALEDSAYPISYKYYQSSTAKNALRSNVKSEEMERYDWPVGKEVWSSSIIGQLRTRTNAQFDLPTEAQWEKAARAGSCGIYYDSNSEEPNKARLSLLAWFYSNSKNGGESCARQKVGQKLPNAYGLYDVIGNVAEMTLDRYAKGYDPTVATPVDTNLEGPLGWTTGDNGVNLRVHKGWNYESPCNDSSRISIHLGNRQSYGVNSGNSRHGFRLCCSAD